jgi:glycosyltransferase involved in cell wall biosynthesis
MLSFETHRARPRRLIVVGALPPPANGMTVATELLLPAVRSAGFDIRHIDTSDRRPLRHVGKLDLRNVLLALRAGIKCCFALIFRRPDVLYLPIAQNTPGFLRDALFLLPARLFQVPVVAHLHGGYFGTFYEQAGRAMRWLIRSGLGGRTHGIVLCESLRSCLAELIPDHRIHVIPNGIDPSGYRPRYELGEGLPIRVLFIGMLSRSKGVFDVLGAARETAKAQPLITFAFAGEWQSNEERREAEQLVSETGIAHIVQWRGVVLGREKAQLLAHSDIFVFPTRYPYEGLPFALLEAMAAGLAIITTDHRCIGEVVNWGSAAVLVEAGDTSEIARQIVRLAHDRESRVAYGLAARQALLRAYTLDRWAEAIVRPLLAACEDGENSSVTVR